MNQNNLIIICVTLIICVGLISFTALKVYTQDSSQNNPNSSNNSVDIKINESNNTTDLSSSNSQKTTAKKKSSSAKSSESKRNWGDYEDDEWVYGHGAGSSDDPDITWKYNKKTGYAEYYNSKTGESWGGYNIA